MTLSIDSKDEAPTLSCCMIVRNEEQFLLQCLESIKDVVDEIIVVDTGSADRTVQIAGEFGAKVYHHPWNNDFSEARNVSLSYATCDWILIMDADEELEQEDGPLLLSLLKSDEYNAIFLANINYLSDGQQSKHYNARVFRRGTMHYEGIVHNQPVIEGNTLSTEIRLHHYGYGLTKEEMSKKHRRTGDLLKHQLEKDPENTFAQMNFVRILRNQHCFDEAIGQGNEFLRQYSARMSPMHRQMISNDVAYCLFATDQYEKAEAMCRQVLEENPDNLDVLFTLGAVLSKRGEHREALRHFKKFLSAKRDEDWRPAFTQLIVDTYTLEDRVWNNVGECYRNMGLLDQAIKAYLKAIRINPEHVNFYKNLAFSYVRQNRPERAEEIFEKAIALGIADEFVFFGLGEVHRSQGEPERAIEAYRKALAIKEDYADAHSALGQILLVQGNLRDAKAELLKTLEHVPDHIGALLSLTQIHGRNGGKKAAMACVDRIVAVAPPNGNLRLHLAGLCIGIGAYPRAIEFIEDHLRSHPTDFSALTDLATCYLHLGKREAALTGYRAALQLNPRHEQALKNLKRLL
ncbi:MAG: tetratricopeptide repeat protein [Candidatus Latescibacteria bacterium]|nr:tetratricopeptide repeat protein [Candidatus Latescibacterota bacterium]MCK5525813.1 tetratricopeptide repeat protein [Candidatus Latescibacterota bacterium]